MYFNRDDKNILIIFVIIFTVALIAIIAILNLVWQVVGKSVGEFFNNFGYAVQASTLDYNFAIPVKKDVQPNPQPIQTQPTPSVKPAANGDKVVNLNYNFPVPQDSQKIPGEGLDDPILEDIKKIYYQNINMQEISRINIFIPKIGIESPVNGGRNFQSLLEKGFWIYPGSGELGRGELVMLCQRSYFGANDPRSCWNINNLAVGDEITLRKNNHEFKYRITIIGTFSKTYQFLYLPISQDQDTIKIVTSDKNNSDKRTVILGVKEN